MKGLSFRTKLTLLNAFVVLGALLVIGIGLIFTTQQAVMRSIENDMRFRAQQLTREVPPALGGPQPRGPGGPNGPPGQGQGQGFGPGQNGGPLDGGPQDGPQNDPNFGGPQQSGGPRNGYPPAQTVGQQNGDPQNGGPQGQNGGPNGQGRQPRGNDGPPPGELPIQERPLFFDPNGKPLAPSNQVEPLDASAIKNRLGPPFFTTVTKDGSRIRVITVPIGRGGRLLGTMQFGRNLDEYDRLVSTQTTLLLILIPLALIVATVAGSFLANRALKPVMDVTDAAAHISESDLGRRLQVSGSDELATLANTFNQMVERLQLSFEQRERLYHELEVALEKQKQFVADASHELRTPLARIKLTTSSALTQSGDEAELRRSLQIADEAADNMSRLVQQLLVLARMDTGQTPKTSAAASVEDAVTAAMRQFKDQEGAEIKVEIEPGLAVSADHEDLVRCLVNLLENSRRYTPDDGNILVQAKAEKGSGLITVKDSGSGIPDEHLAKVTERFYRVDEARSRKDGGCGLGLAICKAIAESHGGSLNIRSKVGEGTAVELRFPLAEI